MTGDVPRLRIEEFIQRHHSLLYRYAYRLSGSRADAEDLTQQTYLIAHQNLHQLRDPSAEKSWLCTILRHAYLRTATQRPTVMPLDGSVEPPQPGRESTCDEEAVQAALARLPEDYRTPVILFYFKELNYKEIADVLAVPLGTVMSRLSRGRTQLKRLLEVHDPAPTQERNPVAAPRQSATKTKPLIPAFTD